MAFLKQSFAQDAEVVNALLRPVFLPRHRKAVPSRLMILPLVQEESYVSRAYVAEAVVPAASA